MTELAFVPEQILRTPCEPVYTAAEAQKIIAELQHRFSQLDDCVGLSAPQIGIAKSVAIIRAGINHIDLINPVITEMAEPFTFHNEGCMSFPGRRWNVARFKSIKLEYKAIWPPDREMSVPAKANILDVKELVVRNTVWLYEHPNEDNPNLMPIAIQHEVDHLNGICLPWKEGAAEIEVIKPLIVNGKIGRNDPCCCGSGKKFKKCCMGKVPEGHRSVNPPSL